MGGAERVLVEFLRRLVRDSSFEALMLVPDNEGPLYSKVSELGVHVHTIRTSERLTQAKKLSLGRTVLNHPALVLSLLRLILRTRRFIRAHQVRIVLTNGIKS